jgi:hypothetical protein
MHQQLWRYKVEEKLHMGVRKQKRLKTTDIENCSWRHFVIKFLRIGDTSARNFTMNFTMKMSVEWRIKKKDIFQLIPLQRNSVTNQI